MSRKFKVGDAVEIVRIADPLFGDVGIVVKDDGDPEHMIPYTVGFCGGVEISFDADDMEKCADIPPVSPPPDSVYQPHHYVRFTIEPITFINANKLPYNIGNVIKYACRYDAKNGVEDLRKAIRYLEIQIETIEREKRIEAGEDKRDVWKVTI